MYTYPQQAIQSLLDGYAAASNSSIRARSILVAKDLFSRYTAILQPGVFTDARLKLPEFPPEGLEGVFPFALHQPREGEPSISAPVYSGDGGADFAASEDYMKRRKAFAEWASQQPDRSLLMLDDKQRYNWLTSGGRFNPGVFFNWWGERKYAAKLLMQGDQSSLLDTYWAGSRELRIAAPQPYVQKRILAK